jgi:hypothetical protein
VTMIMALETCSEVKCKPTICAQVFAALQEKIVSTKIVSVETVTKFAPCCLDTYRVASDPLVIFKVL